MTVQHVLTEKGSAVVTIEPDRTLSEAATLLSDKKIGAVVVSSDGRSVAGILSERDIIRALAREGAGALSVAVSRYMTADVVSCSRDAEMDHLTRIMTVGKFRHVPVVEAGSLVGIISIGDVVKRRLADIEAEHRALKEYIATA